MNVNSIGDDGAKAIAEALKVNPVLTELNLNGNFNIGPEGAKAIAEALKVNPVLTTLSIWDNKIGNEGAKAIAEALKVNPVLTELDLRVNNMGEAGEKAVRDAVKDRNQSVSQLFHEGPEWICVGAVENDCASNVNMGGSQLWVL